MDLIMFKATKKDFLRCKKEEFEKKIKNGWEKAREDILKNGEKFKGKKIAYRFDDKNKTIYIYGIGLTYEIASLRVLEMSYGISEKDKKIQAEHLFLKEIKHFSKNKENKCPIIVQKTKEIEMPEKYKKCFLKIVNTIFDLSDEKLIAIGDVKFHFEVLNFKTEKEKMIIKMSSVSEKAKLSTYFLLVIIPTTVSIKNDVTLHIKKVLQILKSAPQIVLHTLKEEDIKVKYIVDKKFNKQYSKIDFEIIINSGKISDKDM